MHNTYENINLDTLPFINVSAKRGIYFLYRGLELVYIGQTVNLFRRIGQHLDDKTKEFDSYKFLEINGNINLMKIEIFLIKRFQPTYNKARKKTYTREVRNKYQLERYHENKNKVKIVNNFSIL